LQRVVREGEMKERDDSTKVRNDREEVEKDIEIEIGKEIEDLCLDDIPNDVMDEKVSVSEVVETPVVLQGGFEDDGLVLDEEDDEKYKKMNSMGYLLNFVPLVQQQVILPVIAQNKLESSGDSEEIRLHFISNPLRVVGILDGFQGEERRDKSGVALVFEKAMRDNFHSQKELDLEEFCFGEVKWMTIIGSVDHEILQVMIPRSVPERERFPYAIAMRAMAVITPRLPILSDWASTLHYWYSSVQARVRLRIDEVPPYKLIGRRKWVSTTRQGEIRIRVMRRCKDREKVEDRRRKRVKRDEEDDPRWDHSDRTINDVMFQFGRVGKGVG